MFNPFQALPPVDEVLAEEVNEMIDKNEDFVLVDCRTHMEYNDPRLGRISKSILAPLQSLWHHQEELEPYKDKEIVIVCRSGQRSAEACRILNAKGYKTKNLVGGMMKWNQLNFDVER